MQMDKQTDGRMLLNIIAASINRPGSQAII